MRSWNSKSIFWKKKNKNLLGRETQVFSIILKLQSLSELFETMQVKSVLATFFTSSEKQIIKKKSLYHSTGAKFKNTM
jgi:hypothetical protein